ncbi:choice-of-anchor B family protein [Tenacibaculum sp. M341]|uniref:choice-of-anchor B family protein n=1 Tax=Tenacibaculum sp. M341 TaxID=2530339 RepID=UPI00104349BF|nr:choice-of-anchor B family protein [Tenacibaculum sp. M341]TCI93219.1 choice-of-anchor B family protein [Tenacibaculum sp. M341]
MKKIILLSLFAIFIFSCSSDDPTPNNPPDMGDTGGDSGGDDGGDDNTGGDGDDGSGDSGGTRTLCVNGFAGSYPCNDYDLMAVIDNATLAGSASSSGSDIWGWTDATTSKEYAIICMSNTTAFVDVTDPINPVFLGRLNSSAGSNSWRDAKVYGNYVYIVADNVGSHGMQVFDLTKLRNVTSPVNFTADTVYTGVGSCHNIVINESKGMAYLVGCRSANGGGPIFIDISDPLNPTSLGNYSGDGYSHDAQVVTYNGPDAEHAGKEIYIGSNENEVVVLDVTDKANVTKISSISYPQIGYTHQGWFTDNQEYFILGDETDEQSFGFNTRTLIFDLRDLDNPVLSSTYTGETRAIDHNGYVKGNLYYMANYRAGIRVLDISNISAATNSMDEVGFFDTYPSNDNASFNGAWSVYPYFASGNIIISDIERGLFIVRKSGT